ncbi:MAG: hypothetical protein QM820_46455 [Minicystis sp.]
MTGLPRARLLARAIATLGILAGGLQCSRQSDDEARRQAWEQQVAASKARVAVVVRPGDPPRQVIAPPLAVGQDLVADISLVSTVTVHGTGGPTVTRTTNVTAQLHVHARPPARDVSPITFEITDLTGNLPDIDKLPRTGTIQPGAHGEPWVLVLDRPAQGEAGLLWSKDVAGWVRRVLMPIPPEPLGPGAAWRRTWDDYLGYDKVTEIDDYELVAIQNGVAQIKVSATSSASSAAANGQSKATGIISLPVGARAVPTAEWSDQGSATITEKGQVTELKTTGTIRIKPHASP